MNVISIQAGKDPSTHPSQLGEISTVDGLQPFVA